MARSPFLRIAALALPLATGSAVVAPSAAHAQAIPNKVAEFSGLDKITGRIITFDVYINETVQFGALQVTPRVCNNRPLTEAPKTDAFVEVDEITLENKVRRIFTGWMFADSPGLHAVEHPIYDVWLKSCKMTSTVPDPTHPQDGQTGGNAQQAPATQSGETADSLPQTMPATPDADANPETAPEGDLAIPHTPPRPKPPLF